VSTVLAVDKRRGVFDDATDAESSKPLASGDPRRSPLLLLLLLSPVLRLLLELLGSGSEVGAGCRRPEPRNHRTPPSTPVTLPTELTVLARGVK
jgi:hypothetical protein